MNRGFSLALLSALVLPGCAPTRRVIVRDAATGRPVPGANVMAAAPSYNGAGALTDGGGAARVPVSAGDRYILVSRAGYRSAQTDVPDEWPLVVPVTAERK